MLTASLPCSIVNAIVQWGQLLSLGGYLVGPEAGGEDCTLTEKHQTQYNYLLLFKIKVYINQCILFISSFILFNSALLPHHKSTYVEF